MPYATEYAEVHDRGSRKTGNTTRAYAVKEHKRGRQRVRSFTVPKRNLNIPPRPFVRTSKQLDKDVSKEIRFFIREFKP